MPASRKWEDDCGCPREHFGWRSPYGAIQSRSDFSLFLWIGWDIIRFQRCWVQVPPTSADVHSRDRPKSNRLPVDRARASLRTGADRGLCVCKNHARQVASRKRCSTGGAGFNVQSRGSAAKRRSESPAICGEPTDLRPQNLSCRKRSINSEKCPGRKDKI
jgi:hypothetical protein